MSQTIPTNLQDLMRNIKLPFSIPPIETVELPKHPSRTWGKRKYEEVKRLIVHHMASEAPLVNQAKYHINEHNWPGLAYNLVVSGGKLLIANSLDTYTTHAKGANDDSIAIAIHGDLSKRNMTDLERELLYAGIMLVKSIWPNIGVYGHNEVSATSCPCTSMSRIREDIATLEMHTELVETPNATSARIYSAYSRFTDLYTLANQPGKYQAEAQRKCLMIEQAMVDAGILHR